MSRQTSSTAEGSATATIAKGGEGGTRRDAACVRRPSAVDVGRMALVRRAKPPTRALPARVVEVTTVADEPVGAEGHVEVTVGVVGAPGLKLKRAVEPPRGAFGGLAGCAFVQEAEKAGTIKGGPDVLGGAGAPVGWTSS